MSDDEKLNSLSLSVEVENNGIDFSLEAERDFGDKVGKLTITIDDDKTVSAKLKVEF